MTAPDRRVDPRWSVGGELWAAEFCASAGDQLHVALLDLSGFRVDLHDLAKVELAAAIGDLPATQLENVERIASLLAEWLTQVAAEAARQQHDRVPVNLAAQRIRRRATV
jgi:hypothetical protein